MAHPGGRPRKQLNVAKIPNKNYLTVQEVAELTHSHVRTIQARLRDGTLAGKKLGKTWRIYPETLVNEKVGADLNIKKEGEKQ